MDPKTIGQFFTPPHVAQFLFQLMQPTRGRSVFDPFVGEGALLEPFHKAGFPKLSGFDIDPKALTTARKRIPGLRVKCMDAFSLEPPASATFPIVVTNPPYIASVMSTAGEASARTATLTKLLGTSVAGSWLSDVLDAVSVADQAVHGLWRALVATKPGGLCGAVLPLSVLETHQGQRAWPLICALGHLERAVYAPRENWFGGSAEVHTMILVFRRRIQHEPGRACEAWRLIDTTEQATVALAAGGIPKADRRVVSADDPTAILQALRTPASWGAFLEAAAAGLTTLGELCDIARGSCTNANRFFYLKVGDAAGLEADTWQPVLKTPKHHDRIGVSPDACQTAVLTMNPRCRPRTHPNACTYVKQHPHKAQAKKRAQKPWWSLAPIVGSLFMRKSYGDRVYQHISNVPLAADQRFYVLKPKVDVHPDIIAGVLNSSFTGFALECLGRSSMGGGVLDVTRECAHNLPVIDPRGLSERQLGWVKVALGNLQRRNIGSVADEAKRADRTKLDRAVARHLPSVLELRGTLLDDWCRETAMRCGKLS